MVKPLSFEALERKYAEQEEYRIKKAQAKQHAKEKVRLGIKYGNIGMSDERLQELRRKEDIEKRIAYAKKQGLTATQNRGGYGARKVSNLFNIRTPKLSGAAKRGLFKRSKFARG
jgi:hypothetical protein